MTEKEKYQLIVDVWRFWQLHSDIQKADAWWEQLIRDGETFVKNHKYHDTARELIIAIMKIIQEEFKCEQAAKKTRGQAGAGKG